MLPSSHQRNDVSQSQNLCMPADLKNMLGDFRKAELKPSCVLVDQHEYTPSNGPEDWQEKVEAT
jgi:hypothetical protein